MLVTMYFDAWYFLSDIGEDSYASGDGGDVELFLLPE